MIQRLRPEDADLTSAPLLLQCLGALRLRDSFGSELTPRTRKARALLAILALTGRPCSRSRLADLLWSDRGEEQAKSSLRQALFELRHIDAAGALKGSGRDEIELDRDRITTDLDLIAGAAVNDDAEQLAELLGQADAGLLADLDGLDIEFDAWLRLERAHEPSQTLATVLASARRLLDAEGQVSVQQIVAEVQRLDPTSEEAARLAMLIAHRTGDSAALHRHFELLRDRLREECDADPSRETLELLAQLTSVTAPTGLTPPGQREKVDGGTPAEKMPVSSTAESPLRRIGFMVPVAALVVLAGTAIWSDRSPRPIAGQPPLIAVLPFSDGPGDEDFLAQALSDDTRAALSQHGVVRVLGRASTDALAKSNAAPAQYRSKLGVDYLLDGRLRRNGETARIAVSLTRASDGVSVWEASFEGRLGDPAALQAAVAQAIEGRLRGQLAAGGGKRPEQIATTSEVYGLYSRARALLHQRDASQSRAAEQILRRAVALDPNYAPAWASLAVAIHLAKFGPERSAARRVEALSHARRALALAPNLAQAHSALALLGGEASPTAERELLRAVELDPGDAQAWSWLANTRAGQYRLREAMAGYERALRIDPLWRPAAQNMADMSSRLGDSAAMNRLITILTRAGADREFILSLQGQAAIERGDYSGAITPLLAMRRSLPGQEFGSSKSFVAESLIALGYQDEAVRLWNGPDWFAATLRSERIPPTEIEGQAVDAEDYWSTSYFPVFTSRAMVNLGHGPELVRKYRQAFRSPDAFIYATSSNDILVAIAPSVSTALAQSGARREAAFILAAAENRVRSRMTHGPRDRTLLWEMARIRGAQGKREQSAVLIEAAVARGYLPDGIWYALDIAQEPAFNSLRGDKRFEAARRKILNDIARERRELGPINI
jgi:DNA-binding SARP family transcriptional activator/TolB-like protein/cytochrome c-type biogenesis protein CcmH/NrfG